MGHHRRTRTRASTDETRRRFTTLLLAEHFLDPTDHAKFLQNMPDHTQRYRFFATGTFNGNLFP